MENIAFAVTGISFLTAPVEIRDRTAFTDTQKMEMYGLLNQAGIQQAVILSTCNRSEIYFLYENPDQIEEACRLFHQFSGGPLDPYLFRLTGEEALQYLFEVTSGLKSMVIGEDQILGQVIIAEEFSRENGCSKKAMNRIFRDAITSAKKAKTQYKISEYPLSLSYIGIRRLEEVCGINGKRILLLGSGKMSGLALRYLYDKSPAIIYNANRGHKRAEALAKEFPSLELVDFHDRYQILHHCDILVSATSSPHLVIRRENMAPRRIPLCCMDLASPRDIDPRIANDPKVELLDMDYLRAVAETNNQQRYETAEKIREQIKKDLKETIHWLISSRVDETIRTLQERMEQVCGDTCAFLERKLTLNDREKGILQKAVKSSMKRLMREPILNLKQADETTQKQYQDTMEKLFALNSSPPLLRKQSEKEEKTVENQSWNQRQQIGPLPNKIHHSEVKTKTSGA